MKKIIVCVGAFIIMGCTNMKKNEKFEQRGEQNQIQTTAEQDQNNHNCRGSKGEIWSKLKNGCISIFESNADELLPIGENENQVAFSAYILVQEQDAELFIYDHQESVLMKKRTQEMYEGGGFVYDAKEGVLLRGQEAIYKKIDTEK